MDGLVSLTPGVVSRTASGNDIALTIDLNGLSSTTAGFVGILLNSGESKAIADATGCKLTAEQGGVTYLDYDCSSVKASGFVWGFAFKAEDGLWYFYEQNEFVSGNN